MAEDRTFPATPQHRRRLAERGEMPRSREMVSALLLLASLGLLRIAGPSIFAGAALALDRSAAALPRARDIIEGGKLGAHAAEVGTALVFPLALLIGGGAVAAIVANVAQVGIRFTSAVLQPRLDRLSPATRMRPSRIGTEMVRGLFKFAVIAAVLVLTLLGHADLGARVAVATPAGAMAIVTDILMEAGLRVGVVFLVLAVADLVWVRIRFERNSRMNRSDFMRDMRDLVGDPVTKQMADRFRRRLRRGRLGLGAVPAATGVVTNPTHVAVAFRFDPVSGRLPFVVAKGAGAAAERIKSVARETGVPVVEHPPLARALFAHVAVGEDIPDLGGLWKVISEVLGVIYRMDPSRIPAGYDLVPEDGP